MSSVPEKDGHRAIIRLFSRSGSAVLAVRPAIVTHTAYVPHKRCKSRRLDIGHGFAVPNNVLRFVPARTRNPYARTRGLACAARGRGPGSRGPPPAPPLLSPTLMHLNGTQRESMPPHGCRAQGVCTCLLTAYSRMKSVCAEWAPRALHSVQSKVISGNQCKYSATRAPHSVRKVPISFHAACYAHT